MKDGEKNGKNRVCDGRPKGTLRPQFQVKNKPEATQHGYHEKDDPEIPEGESAAIAQEQSSKKYLESYRDQGRDDDFTNFGSFA